MSTMGCAEFREFLLSAEPQQLRGAYEWHEHLQTCASCGARAAAILAGYDDLGGALRTLTERDGQDATRSAGPVGIAGAAAGMGSVRSWRRRVPALGLAMAAAVLLMFWQQLPRKTSPLPPRADPAVRVPTTPVVNGAGASGVAVMPTSDPDITVVWTF